MSAVVDAPSDLPRVVEFARRAGEQGFSTADLLQHFALDDRELRSIMTKLVASKRIARIPGLTGGHYGLLARYRFVKYQPPTRPTFNSIDRPQYRNGIEYLEINGHDEDFEPRPCATASRANPGTAEKISELAARYERGEELWHPDDESHLEGFFGCAVLVKLERVCA